MFTVTKEFTVDYAHRLLLPYESKCSNIHGHTGKILLSISIPKIFENLGMVVDFVNLKIVCDEVREIFDHKLILNSEDEMLVDFIRHNTDFALVVLDGMNPTSENLARFAVQYAVDYFADLLKPIDKWTIGCTFYETPTSSATYKLTSREFMKTLNELRKIEENKCQENKEEENKEDKKNDEHKRSKCWKRHKIMNKHDNDENVNVAEEHNIKIQVVRLN